jgi:CRP-like cAMP-binding protein
MAIDDDINFLELVPTFAVLGREALRIIAIGAEVRYLQSGEVLFVTGDPADAGYVIQEGAFRLKSSPMENDAYATVVGRGALLGEFALLAETTRPMTAVAAEPSNVLRIPRSLFLKMLDGYPDAAYRLRDHMMIRANRTAEQIHEVRTALDPNRQRR